MEWQDPTLPFHLNYIKKVIISGCSKKEGAKQIAVLTGAGISTESGIPDFRSNKGLWNTYTEHKLSTNYLRYDPRDFWSFFKELFALKTAETYLPNDGHQFLVKLEELGKQVTVITQNIDGLHQKAGSTNSPSALTITARKS